MDVYAGWQQEFLLLSDVHLDNPHCDRRLLRKHLMQAKEKGAGVLSFGDMNCAMQGDKDKRKNKADLLPQHAVPHYFDALVDESAEFLSPVSDLLVLMTYGNHETAIIRHNETDLVKRLATTLNERYNGNVFVGGYNGDVRFSFSNGGHKIAKTLYYSHGSGGGGEVTRGTIKSARRAVYVSDSDIVFSGHIHEAWYMELVKRRHKKSRGGVELFTQYHVQSPTYKQEYGSGSMGYHNFNERPPKPLGAWWMKFRFENGEIKVTFERAN